MLTPGWYALLLLSLAAFRSWRLIAVDTILDKPRARLPQPWQEFLECPWCTGFWVGLAWWGAYQATPHWTLVASVPLAVSVLLSEVWSLPGS